MSKMIISKLDAAKRLLETAILLFLHNTDPVSIHTLTEAAYDVLKDYAKNENITITLDLKNYLKPEKVKEIQKILNKPKNFFKHADRDHKSSIEFNPYITIYDIWDACLIFERITSERIPLFVCFHLWFNAYHKDIIKEIYPNNIGNALLVLVKNMDPNNRIKFLEFRKYVEKINNSTN